VAVEEMGNFNFAPADLPFVEELAELAVADPAEEYPGLAGGRGSTEGALEQYPSTCTGTILSESMIPYQIARTYEVYGPRRPEAIPYYEEALEH
jgi:hypothetical protein